eukprot:756307-Hanusia_phi.AAC.9
MVVGFLLLPSSVALPTYRDVEKDSVVAVCIISHEREVAGLKIALSTVLSSQVGRYAGLGRRSQSFQIRNVQIFTFAWIEDAIAEAIGSMVSLIGSETVRIVIMPYVSLTHHEYGMLLKKENFWWACDGEWVLIFQVRPAWPRFLLTQAQSDTLLCLGSNIRLDEFMVYDYVGAPFLPGECPSLHDKERSMCQNDFDRMAAHEGLQVPAPSPHVESRLLEDSSGRGRQRRAVAEEEVQNDRNVPGKQGDVEDGRMTTWQKCGSLHPFYLWQEDIFFSYPCDNVTLRFPPEPVGVRRCTGLFNSAPFGIHKVWFYRNESELLQLLQACRELLLLIPKLTF